MTAWGAALLAGLQAGVFRDLDEITAGWRQAALFKPGREGAVRSGHAGWLQAVARIAT